MIESTLHEVTAAERAGEAPAPTPPAPPASPPETVSAGAGGGGGGAAATPVVAVAVAAPPPMSQMSGEVPLLLSVGSKRRRGGGSVTLSTFSLGPMKPAIFHIAYALKRWSDLLKDGKVSMEDFKLLTKIRLLRVDDVNIHRQEGVH